MIRVLSLMALAGLTVVMASCVKHNAGNNQPTTLRQAQAAPAAIPVSTDVKKLSKLVTLSYRPLSVVWREKTMGASGSGAPGPTDYSLTAVLRFRPQDMSNIESAALKVQSAKNAEMPVQGWFPAWLQKHVVKKPNGDQVIRGRRLDASAFHKMSLSQGYLLRVGQTSIAVLALHTT
jgi:hypothetical protein